MHRKPFSAKRNPSRNLLTTNSSFELLETRQHLSASLHPHAKTRHTVTKHAPVAIATPIDVTATANASASPANSAYTPSQIRSAYGYDQINIPGVTSNGAGQTIAIIDAYDDPDFVNTGSANFASSDLHKFDTTFGLQDPPSFTKVNETGGTTLPATNSGWDGEIALDIEWTHALAPAANIVLVEANSSNSSDLISSAVNTANLSGVSVVSMSFGMSEFSGESSYFDQYFKTPAGHQGVTFVASTGDTGSPGEYPAYSPNVVAVGGTSLTINRSTGAYVSETAWSGSGGGISTQEAQPAYQKGIVTQTTTHRAEPDLSFVADPNTGVAVYDSVNGGASTPWLQVGGTSLSAPSIAATVALADQARVAAGTGTLEGATQTLPQIYSLPSADFHDVTTGSNGGFSAGAGYDLITGRGTPIANLFVPGLAGVAAATAQIAPSTPDLATASDSGVNSTDNITNINTPTFTGTATAGSTVTLFAGSTQIGSAVAGSGGTYSITSSALADGTYNITASTSGGTSSRLPVTIDTTSPTVSSEFDYQTSQQLVFRFGENLGMVPTASSLTLSNTTTGQTVSAAASYNSASETLTYTFPAGILANGDYQATLAASSIQDVAGNSPATNPAASFFVLAGDANHDGVVNATDYAILSANYGKSGIGFSQGDFNYDGVVNSADFSILSANYGKTVTPPVASNAVAASLFTDVPIGDSLATSVL